MEHLDYQNEKKLLLTFLLDLLDYEKYSLRLRVVDFRRTIDQLLYSHVKLFFK